MSLADPPETQAALEHLLRWYADMGVDAALDEAPHDRFTAPTPPRQAEAARPAEAPGRIDAPRMAPVAAPERRASGPARPIDATPASADTLVRQAETLAAEARDLDDLRARWEALPGCNLAATASRMIFADGAAGSPLMLIGAAPETDDERQGAAFAGTHGKLLDAMLRAIGRDRASTYLTNVIPWRPPGGRAPSPLELALCLPFARRHIALAAPTVILCLGERAAQPLLGTRDPLSKLRGRWLAYEGESATIKTLVSFSPDYLLRQPLQKRQAWADLQMVRDALSHADRAPD